MADNRGWWIIERGGESRAIELRKIRSNGSDGRQRECYRTCVLWKPSFEANSPRRSIPLAWRNGEWAPHQDMCNISFVQRITVLWFPQGNNGRTPITWIEYIPRADESVIFRTWLAAKLFKWKRARGSFVQMEECMLLTCSNRRVHAAKLFKWENLFKWESACC